MTKTKTTDADLIREAAAHADLIWIVAAQRIDPREGALPFAPIGYARTETEARLACERAAWFAFDIVGTWEPMGATGAILKVGDTGARFSIYPLNALFS